MAGACKKVRTVREFECNRCDVLACVKFAIAARSQLRMFRLAQGTRTRGCITTVCRQGRVCGYAQMVPSTKVIGGWGTGATSVYE